MSSQSYLADPQDEETGDMPMKKSRRTFPVNDASLCRPSASALWTKTALQAAWLLCQAEVPRMWLLFVCDKEQELLCNIPHKWIDWVNFSNIF